jgi:hypothetical protein
MCALCLGMTRTQSVDCMAHTSSRTAALFLEAPFFSAGPTAACYPPLGTAPSWLAFLGGPVQSDPTVGSQVCRSRGKDRHASSVQRHAKVSGSPRNCTHKSGQLVSALANGRWYGARHGPHCECTWRWQTGWIKSMPLATTTCTRKRKLPIRADSLLLFRSSHTSHRHSKKRPLSTAPHPHSPP